jgi:very-short-patch-repair endonuclease
LLWWRLRGGQLGVRFRREDPIGDYIADFSCRARRLVIEADGGTHTEPDRDCARDSWFLAQGWTVLRFGDDEITDQLDDVIEMIYMALDDPRAAMDLLNDGNPHRRCSPSGCQR